MAKEQNISNSNTTQNAVPVQPTTTTSTWVTVNTSTSSNVTSMEISKSEDYDRVIKSNQ